MIRTSRIFLTFFFAGQLSVIGIATLIWILNKMHGQLWQERKKNEYVAAISI